MAPRKPNFALQAAPFLLLMACGSWGLSQFLKLPVQMKDDRARRRREGREKFDLQKEHEVRASMMLTFRALLRTVPSPLQHVLSTLHPLLTHMHSDVYCLDCLHVNGRSSKRNSRKKQRLMRISGCQGLEIRIGSLPTRSRK
eukprot:scaffold143642_cov32-Tisochrysis_lutea.AAC.5